VFVVAVIAVAVAVIAVAVVVLPRPWLGRSLGRRIPGHDGRLGITGTVTIGIVIVIVVRSVGTIGVIAVSCSYFGSMILILILILLGQETSKPSSNGIVIAVVAVIAVAVIDVVVGSRGTTARQGFAGISACCESGFFTRNAHNVSIATYSWRGRRRRRGSHGVMIGNAVVVVAVAEWVAIAVTVVAICMGMDMDIVAEWVAVTVAALGASFGIASPKELLETSAGTAGSTGTGTIPSITRWHAAIVVVVVDIVVVVVVIRGGRRRRRTW
jgi:hypothetical protein